MKTFNFLLVKKSKRVARRSYEAQKQTQNKIIIIPLIELALKRTIESFISKEQAGTKNIYQSVDRAKI